MIKQNKAKIIERIVVSGRLRLLSPLLIGNGENYNSDCDIIKDTQGNPFIPGSSLAGAVRNHLFCLSQQEDFGQFFGEARSSSDDMSQSAVIFDDLFLNDSNDSKETIINTRDGVRIENKTGQAADQGKFDFEILEPGVTFKFSMELIIREKDLKYKDSFKQLLSTILSELHKEKIRIGARNTYGFGKVKLEEAHINLYTCSKKDVISWLTLPYYSNGSNSKPENSFDLSRYFTKFVPSDVTSNDFSINAHFRLKSSLIIRSYNKCSDTGEHAYSGADSTQLQYGNGTFVLPGSSIKGALKHQAERILKTLQPDKQNYENILYKLMGHVSVDNKNNKNNANQATDDIKQNWQYKSKLVVEEVPISGVQGETQSRTHIDRFTQGTRNSLLFDSKPVWANKDENQINVKILIKNYKDYEAGLVLLLLKDLWSGSLPLGGEKNVGRGILIGTEAVANFGDHQIEIKSQNGKLILSRMAGSERKCQDVLEEKVKSLLKELGVTA